jgi:hypothetical protein
MSPPPAVSRSSADLPPGTLLAGFRVERVIGRGSRATVYEATQLSLDRRVALKVMGERALADRVRRLTWPEHRGAVGLFGVGDSPHGPWLAMQLVSGGTLEARRAPLDAVEAALAQAHAAGIVHGDVSARNVLVEDGRAYLSDFGLAGDGVSAEDDDAALAELVRDRSARAPSRRRAVPAAAIAIAGVALAGVVVLLSGGLSRDDGAGVPPEAPTGTRSIGSDLAPGDIASVDCNGRGPSGSSLACTISQRELGGRAIVAPRAGTITSWAVRGARGTLALQVLRERNGRSVQIEKTAEETVAGPAVHVARSHVVVAAGDRVALEVAPGTAVGIRRTGARASTDRWFGPLVRPARRPERPPGTGLDRELLLRVDLRPGVAPIARLRGASAAGAPAGLRVAARTVAVGRGEVRTVAVVVLGAGVAIDLLDGTRRLARAPMAGADGRGQLVAVNARRGAVRVRWRNPGGGEVDPRFAVTASALR